VTGGGTDFDDSCPGCGAGVAAVVITVEQRVVLMRSCNRCDRRWWTADGEAVDPVALFAKQ
jgi:hypothetical protein